MTSQDSKMSHQYMKNRSRLDIIAAILKVVNTRETSKTRIMYGAYLSYLQLREYMPILTGNDLLTSSNEQESIYKIKERGIRFLEIYQQLNEMIAINSRDSVYE
jgi:predicted transcriptional regulator